MIFERVFPGEKTITSHSVLITTFFFPATVENIHSCKKGCRYFWNHWFCFAKPIFGNLFAKERHVYFHHTDLHFDCPASNWKRNGLWKETFMDTCCANRIKIFVRFATTIFVQTLLPHESRCFQVTLVAFGSQLVAFGPHHIPPTLLSFAHPSKDYMLWGRQKFQYSHLHPCGSMLPVVNITPPSPIQLTKSMVRPSLTMAMVLAKLS